MTKERHYHLILWPCKCVKHILLYYTKTIDSRLTNALEIARNWTKDNASVGQARQASLNTIEVAQESNDELEIPVAHSLGHTVATAHMADHSLISMKYALKAVKLAIKSIDMERKYPRRKFIT